MGLLSKALWVVIVACLYGAYREVKRALHANEFAVDRFVEEGCSTLGDSPWFSIENELKQLAHFNRSAHMLQTSQHVRMRDGVMIAVDTIVPDWWQEGRDEPLPCILMQTRYHRSHAYRPWVRWILENVFDVPRTRHMRHTLDRKGIRRFFVANGYCFIDVDARGSGASTGERVSAFDKEEILDGEEVLNWLVKQPFSNGRVGTLGVSYSGIAADHVSSHGHKALLASMPLYSPVDLYIEHVRPGGVFVNWLMGRWRNVTHELDKNTVYNLVKPAFLGPLVYLLLDGVNPVDTDENNVILEEAIAQHHNNWHVYNEARLCEFRDDQVNKKNFIDDISPISRLERVKESSIPVYSWSGWSDGSNQHAAIRRFRHLTKDGNSVGHRLLLGSFQHAGLYGLDDRSKGQASCFPSELEYLRFMDSKLRFDDPLTEETRKSFEVQAPVHYYTIGTDRWTAAETFPPPEARRRQLTASTESSLQDVLVWDADARASDKATALRADGANFTTGSKTRWNSIVDSFIPCDYANADSWIPRLKRGYTSESAVVFASAPLIEDTEITGVPTVNVWATFECPACSSVFAYLLHIDEDGAPHYITEGQLAARFHEQESEAWPEGAIWESEHVPVRQYRREDMSVPTNEHAVLMHFHLLPTSFLVPKGHSLALAVASLDTSLFDVEFVRSCECVTTPHVDKPHVLVHHNVSVDLPLMPK